MLEQSHNDIHHRNASLLLFFCFLLQKEKKKGAPTCVSLEKLTGAELSCLPELIDFRGETRKRGR